jgi:hypothetical protein
MKGRLLRHESRPRDPIHQNQKVVASRLIGAGRKEEDEDEGIAIATKDEEKKRREGTNGLGEYWEVKNSIPNDAKWNDPTQT